MAGRTPVSPHLPQLVWNNVSHTPCQRMRHSAYVCIISIPNASPPTPQTDQIQQKDPRGWYSDSDQELHIGSPKRKWLSKIHQRSERALGQLQHPTPNSTMDNGCYENCHSQKLSSLGDHPQTVSWCCPKHPCHKGERSVLSQSRKLCIPPSRKVCHSGLMTFALLQDTVLHLKMSALCKKLGRRDMQGTSFLPSLFGRSTWGQSMS